MAGQEYLTHKTLPYEIRSRLNEFTGSEYKVWTCLLSHANSKHGGKAWCGVTLMMRETGLSKHGVDDAISGLRAKGWISRYQSRNNATGQRTTASTWCKWPPTIPGSHWDRIERRIPKSDTQYRVATSGAQ